MKNLCDTFHSNKPIARLHYPGLATFGLDATLHQLYPSRRIFHISPDHHDRNELRKYSLLVLPGSIGEDSPYSCILTKRRVDNIWGAMEDHGLKVWTICAPTYYLLNEIIFQCRDGRVKHIKGHGRIEGISRGPAYKDITHKNPHNAPDRDIVIATITIQSSHAHHHLIDINGPALHISQRDPLTDIFLRHVNISGRPAAGFTQKVGNGSITGISVHPEISFNHPLFFNVYGHLEQQRWTFLRTLKKTLG